MSSVRVLSSHPSFPRRLRARVALAAALVALASGLAPGAARAGPVVQPDSSYSVYLNQASTDSGSFRYANRFDGVAESFTHRGVSLAINDAQTDLRSGRYAIDITLDFAGGDPFPVASMVTGIGIGVGTSISAGDVLDLTGTVALTAAQVFGRFADGSALDFDAFPAFAQLASSTQPWGGDMFNGYFLGLNWSGRGLTQLRVHFETAPLQGVPSPGTLPLVALGLGVAATALRRRPA